MTNPATLERQLIHLDLRKGMNERVRPETGDPSSLLTRVENLLQDQDGCWVKRPGLATLGDTIASVKRLVRLRGGGLGAIYGAGRFAAYSEGSNTWVEQTGAAALGKLPHFMEDVDQLVGSMDRDTSTISAFASNSKYHYIAYEGGTNITSRFISVYDRATGSLIKTYRNMTNMGTNPKFVFVADRYLFTFFGNSAGTSLYAAVTDTDTTYEIDTAISPIVTGLGGAPNATPVDVAAGTDRAFVTTLVRVASVSTAGALNEEITPSTAVTIAASPDKLWMCGTTDLEARDINDLTTTLVAAAAHGGGANNQIAVTASNRVYATVTNSVTMGTQSVQLTETRVTTADDDTTFDTQKDLVGWYAETPPFYMAGSNSVYVHVRKDEVGVSNSIQAVVNITNGALEDLAGLTGAGKATWKARPEAVLEPFNAVPRVNYCRILPHTSSAIVFPQAVRTVARGLSYNAHCLKLFDYATSGQCLFGEQAFVGAATPSSAGGSPQEIGFTDFPLIDAVDSGAAGNLSGSYKYVAVHRYVDETGCVFWSRTSPIESLTVASKSATVKVLPMTVGLRRTGGAGEIESVVEVYRTASGGTIYYLCGSSATGTTVQSITLDADGFWDFTDDYADSTLQTQALLFRQPGTPNAPLDRYSCPPTKVMTAHKDRVYVTLGNHVYYSSFFVDGEGPWFHPQFGFYCHGGSGPITGMASMDGRLLVFKSDAVFVVDGDGPAEGGVVGNEFSPPQRIATEYGCVDHRSLQVFAGGCIYRSSRGIEQLTRGLELRNVGDRVLTTQEAYPYTIGSVIDQDSHYRLILSTAAPSPAASGQCVELVYDLLSDCWSTSKFTDSTLVYGASLQDIGINDDAVVYADAVTGVYRGSGYLDVAAYVPWTLETGWIRTGQQARQLLEKLFFLGKQHSNHAITVDAAYNYADGYTDTETWQPDAFDGAVIEELCKNCEEIQTLAVKFRVSDSAPADTAAYPVGTGQGCDILGLTVQVAVKAGGPKVAKDQKG